MLITLADFLIFIALSFVGDHALFDVFPSYFIVWPVLIMYRLITRLDITELELIVQSVLLLLLLPWLINGIIQSDFYYFSFIYVVLYINALPVLYRLLDSVHLPKVIVALFILLLPLLILSWSISRLDINNMFVFGPNILYRIYAMMFLLVFIANQLRPGMYSRNLVVVAFVISAIALVSTGSRGGTLLVLGELALLFYLYRDKPATKYLFYCALLITSYYIYSYWELVSTILGRAVFFDLTNNSENTRIQMYLTMFEFFDIDTSWNILFGVGNESHYYPIIYPHNFFVEAIVYHGALFAIGLAFMMFYGIKAGMRDYIGRYVLMFYFPIFFGAMLSGSFLDNYHLISVTGFFLVKAIYNSKQIRQTDTTANAQFR